ncbi:DUF2730 family protein [Desulfuromonas sp. TF]|uniref:DUF2730 family protein n=1 Tax=Desulfuromonas sp. TF TaxID=1232410 RepID=UPI00041F1E05|nr:DUF2730 family protein [Desulfuromonas sp. TF]
MAAEIDYTAWRFWFDILQVGGLVALGVYSWWKDREKVTSKRFAAMEREVAERATKAALAKAVESMRAPCQRHLERTDNLEERATRVEGEIRHLPSQSDHKELARRIEDVHADLHEITGALKGLTRAVDLMNEHLLNGGGKR